MRRRVPLVTRVRWIHRHERQPLGGERGVALVEFAFVLPILVILVLGMVDIGKAINYWNDQTHLANEAARYAVVNGSPDANWVTNPTTANYKINCTMKNQADSDELKNGTGSISPQTPPAYCTNGTSGMVVSICFPNGTYAIGDPVQVKITSSYKWLDYLVGKFGSPGASLIGKATMRIEKAPNDPDPAHIATSTDAYVATTTC
jgi:Flp pilus assembly protein TadG